MTIVLPALGKGILFGYSQSWLIDNLDQTHNARPRVSSKPIGAPMPTLRSIYGFSGMLLPKINPISATARA